MRKEGLLPIRHLMTALAFRGHRTLRKLTGVHIEVTALAGACERLVDNHLFRP